MAESKYSATNMLREDYEPFKKYCNEHNIVIKQALAEATNMWLDSKTSQHEYWFGEDCVMVDVTDIPDDERLRLSLAPF